MYKMLRDKNEGLRKGAMDFAQRLVKIPSPSLNEKGVADAVEKEMTALKYDRVFRDRAGNVVRVPQREGNEPCGPALFAHGRGRRG